MSTTSLLDLGATSIAVAHDAGSGGRGVFLGTANGVYALPSTSATPVPSGLAGTSVTSLLMSPAFAVDRTLYAGTHRGVFTSVDGGKTWSSPAGEIRRQRVNDLVLGHDRSLYAATRAGLFVSPDAAASWRKVAGLGPRNVLTAASFAEAQGGSVMLAGAAQGLYRSSDGGVTWNAVSLPVEVGSRSVKTIVVSHGASGAMASIYIGTIGGGIVQSTDGGRTWAVMRTGERGLIVYDLALLGTEPTVLAAATLDRGIWVYGARVPESH